MSGTLNQTRDLHLDMDMTFEAYEVSGVRALAERLLRRITTSKGMFEWWPNDGYDARDALLSKIPPWKIKAAIENECMKDEQVVSIVATVTVSADGRTMTVLLNVTTEQGDYDFTMGITQAAATLIALQKSNS